MPDQISRLNISPADIDKMGISGKLIEPPVCKDCRSPQKFTRKTKGYVYFDCLKCTSTRHLSAGEFYNLAVLLTPKCPVCSQTMVAQQGGDGSNNYGFCCHSCHHFVWFADLLPQV